MRLSWHFLHSKPKLDNFIDTRRCYFIFWSSEKNLWYAMYKRSWLFNVSVGLTFWFEFSVAMLLQVINEHLRVEWLDRRQDLYPRKLIRVAKKRNSKIKLKEKHLFALHPSFKGKFVGRSAIQNILHSDEHQIYFVEKSMPWSKWRIWWIVDCFTTETFKIVLKIELAEKHLVT